MEKVFRKFENKQGLENCCLLYLIVNERRKGLIEEDQDREDC